MSEHRSTQKMSETRAYASLDIFDSGFPLVAFDIVKFPKNSEHRDLIVLECTYADSPESAKNQEYKKIKFVMPKGHIVTLATFLLESEMS